MGFDDKSSLLVVGVIVVVVVVDPTILSLKESATDRVGDDNNCVIGVVGRR